MQAKQKQYKVTSIRIDPSGSPFMVFKQGYAESDFTSSQGMKLSRDYAVLDEERPHEIYLTEPNVPLIKPTEAVSEDHHIYLEKNKHIVSVRFYPDSAQYPYEDIQPSFEATIDSQALLQLAMESALHFNGPGGLDLDNSNLLTTVFQATQAAVSKQNNFVNEALEPFLKKNQRFNALLVSRISGITYVENRDVIQEAGIAVNDTVVDARGSYVVRH